MTEAIDGVCKNCAAWAEVPAQGAVEIGAPKRGLCRMFPPTPVPTYNAQGQVAGQIHLRPVVPENDACLHFVVNPMLAPQGVLQG